MRRIKSDILVIGCGTWPTTIAQVLAENGNQVALWCHRPQLIEEINTTHTHSKLLPDVRLSPNICAVEDLSDSVRHASAVIIGLASSYLHQIPQNLSTQSPVLSLTKGLLPHPYIRVSEFLKTCFINAPISVLSGPNLAKEIIQKKPSATVIASEDQETAQFFQKILSNSYFRAYTSKDVPGVELGGVLKNVMAIASGISDGLHLGSNAKAALITRGLQEILRFTSHFGASKDTVFGLSGLGDLIATCDSIQSRNYRVGLGLAEGKPLDTILQTLGQHAEGVNTTKEVVNFAEMYHIDMPVTKAVYDVLYNGITPKQALHQLMARELKAE